MKRLFAGALASALVALVALASAACDDAWVSSPACKNIPAGGCPSASNDPCVDPECSAIYACGSDTVWRFERACPVSDAGPREASVRDGASDTNPVSDAAVDAPPGAYGGPGCIELQSPDCPAGRALGCAQGCCDCEDLFVCTAGAWAPWGKCADGVVTTL